MTTYPFVSSIILNVPLYINFWFKLDATLIIRGRQMALRTSSAKDTRLYVG